MTSPNAHTDLVPHASLVKFERIKSLDRATIFHLNDSGLDGEKWYCLVKRAAAEWQLARDYELLPDEKDDEEESSSSVDITSKSTTTKSKPSNLHPKVPRSIQSGVDKVGCMFL